MTTFQFLAESVLGVLLGVELGRAFARRDWSLARLIRVAVWIAAAVAIWNPDGVQQLAAWLGIGRAADLVLYTVALSFVGTTFFLYARCVRLDRRVTQLAQQLALLEARQRGSSGPE